MEIAHVAEKVFGHFFYGFDRWSGGGWGPAYGIVEVRMREGGWGWWMPNHECGNQDAEEKDDKRKNGEEVWIQTYKGVDEEQRGCVCPIFPGKETNDSSLKDKDDADTRVESTKVIGHGGYIEVWPFDETVVRRCRAVRVRYISSIFLSKNFAK